LSKTICRSLFILAVISPCLFAADVDVAADLPADAFQVAYAPHVTLGFEHVTITNSGNFGTSTTIGGHDANDLICADLYVFDPAQELIACCSCTVTPNDLQTVATSQLVSDSLTSVVPPAVTIGLLATQTPASGFCDPGSVTPAALAPGLRAWNTVVHVEPGGGYAVTEFPFSLAPLSPAELFKMTDYCAFIEADGTFNGICKSCVLGAAGAAKQ